MPLAFGDTITFRNPERSWNGRVIKDPAEFHFKHRAKQAGYFEFERGSGSNRIGMLEDNPNILKIEINSEYGDEEILSDRPGPGVLSTARDEGSGGGDTSGPGGVSAVGSAQPGEKLDVLSVRDWIYPVGTDIPLRPGNVISANSMVRTPVNSRAKVGYKDAVQIGLMPDTQLDVQALARETQTGTYLVRIAVGEGGEAWLLTDQIRLSDRVQWIVNGISFETETRATLVKVVVTPEGQVVIAYYGHERLDLSSPLGERSTLVTNKQVNMTAEEASVEPAGSRADWDNWDIWTPERITYEPELHPVPVPVGPPWADFAIVQVGDAGDLPKPVPVQPQGTLQIIQQWRQGIYEYIQMTGYAPQQSGEAGLEAVRQKVDFVSDELPTRDNWGNPFAWQVYLQGNKVLIDVHSKGANRIDDFGLGDDL